MKYDHHIIEHIRQGHQTLSVEFSPPRTDDAGRQILKTAALLRERLNPDFVSITYGAGGSTRERTQEYARLLRTEYGFDVVAHLTCVGSSKEELRSIVRDFRKAGLSNIMALRGDPPKGQAEFRPHPDGCAYANELVELIRQTEPEFCIGVAGYPETHPQALSPEQDLINLKRKVDAGASFITTQLFFDNSHFFSFVERCRAIGISVPIIPGLMPALSLDQAIRFGNMNGSSVPKELERRLAAVDGDEVAQRQAGIDWAHEQARELIENGVNTLHLYIMNRSESALGLVDRLSGEGVLRRD
ncbi:MAG: methylenetetrahydrofolate reductase [NAD(P)H] [Opitutales bacterium]|jgi:methylenetetrahydrofolate reductase (NADPH)